MYFWEKCQKPEGWRVKKISKTLDKNVHFNALGRMTEAKFWVFVGILFMFLFQQPKNFIAFLSNSLSSYYPIYIHLMFNPFLYDSLSLFSNVLLCIIRKWPQKIWLKSIISLSSVQQVLLFGEESF